MSGHEVDEHEGVCFVHVSMFLLLTLSMYLSALTAWKLQSLMWHPYSRQHINEQSSFYSERPSQLANVLSKLKTWRSRDPLGFSSCSSLSWLLKRWWCLLRQGCASHRAIILKVHVQGTITVLGCAGMKVSLVEDAKGSVAAVFAPSFVKLSKENAVTFTAYGQSFQSCVKVAKHAF